MTNYLKQEQRKNIIMWVVLSLLALGGAFLLATVLSKETYQMYECEKVVETPNNKIIERNADEQ